MDTEQNNMKFIPTRCSRFICRFIRGLALIVFLTGCDDGGGDNSSGPGTDYPDIAGDWSGTYYQTHRAGGEALTASIKQSEDAVIIKTSRADGVGKSFTGSISTDGEMILTDAFDGETWTTYYGPSDSSQITIADYLYPPRAGEAVKPPLQVIRLKR